MASVARSHERSRSSRLLELLCAIVVFRRVAEHFDHQRRVDDVVMGIDPVHGA
jgi:hypothetical protein